MSKCSLKYCEPVINFTKLILGVSKATVVDQNFVLAGFKKQ